LNKTGQDSESGVALFLAVVAVIAFVGISFSMIASSLATSREYSAAKDHVQRLYIAEAGASMALNDIFAGGTGKLGSPKSPVSFGAGSFAVAVVEDEVASTVTVTSVGWVGGEARALRVVLKEPGGVFHHAMFAGNSNGDPTYSLDLGGTGTQADEIHGDIYVGGDIVVTGDAVIDGDARASGTITGTKGTEGFTQPAPDLQSLDFDSNHDVNVAAEFAAHGVYQSNAHGGDAWQVDAAYASHILRMNPSDRNAEILGTEKNDYFLEDPYEAAAHTTRISVADGTDGAADGNAKVYFIDGNLWLHSAPAVGFQFDHLAGGTRMTFVVKGNIYFADDLTLSNKEADGVAFIALKDAAVADSGNIYFGDPKFGTLLIMEGFMYAENNFYDNNLLAAGSKTVSVTGIMSAGNHVAVFRDYGENHTKLALTFDDRIKRGLLELPGVPDFERASSGKLALDEVTSFEISVTEAEKAFK
jgi:hypothetical protein